MEIQELILRMETDTKKLVKTRERLTKQAA
jgi:hypothetical protein